MTVNETIGEYRGYRLQGKYSPGRRRRHGKGGRGVEYSETILGTVYQSATTCAPIPRSAAEGSCSTHRRRGTMHPELTFRAVSRYYAPVFFVLVYVRQ